MVTTHIFTARLDLLADLSTFKALANNASDLVLEGHIRKVVEIDKQQIRALVDMICQAAKVDLASVPPYTFSDGLVEAADRLTMANVLSGVEYRLRDLVLALRDLKKQYGYEGKLECQDYLLANHGDLAELLREEVATD